MSTTHTGSASGLVERTDAVAITIPSDGDSGVVSSVNTALNKLADFLKLIQDKAAFVTLVNDFIVNSASVGVDVHQSGSGGALRGTTASATQANAGVCGISSGLASGVRCENSGGGLALDVQGAAAFPAPTLTTVTVFGTNWGDGGDANHPSPKYWKDPYGYVHLEGCVVVSGGTPGGTAAFNLPAGYRPAGLPGTGLRTFANFRESAGGYGALIAINAAGDVIIDSLYGADPAFSGRAHLDGIYFRTT